MFYGQGAGGAPTASAVLGDVVAVARHKVTGGRGPGESVVRRPEGAPDRRDAARATTSASTWPTARACSRRSRPPSPSTMCRSRPSARRSAAATTPSLVIVTHPAPDAAAVGDGRGAARARRRAARAQRDAGGGTVTAPSLAGRHRPSTATGFRWAEDAGSSPWARVAPRSCLAEHLSELTGCEVHLKVEGANPTGSFKDRGMTVAITEALGEGATAVICASTGNTSASAAAYAVKAGLDVRRPGPARADRGRQAGAGAGARRAAAAGRGRLRRLPAPGPGRWPTSTRSRWSTR